MRALLAIIFWALAAVEGAVLLFMLFVSLAAGPRMAENGDLATPLFWNVLLPLAGLIGAILLFSRGKAPAWRVIALIIVVAPVLWLLSWTEGETIYTTFENSSATGEVR